MAGLVTIQTGHRGFPGKKNIAVVMLCILVLLPLFCKTALAQDPNRSFYFPDVTINAEVHPDGSMTVTEERTFQFSGTFRGITQQIKLQGSTAFHDVTVGEPGIVYKEVPAGTTEGTGIFFVDQDSKYFYIDWSFEAYNEKRTFIINYRVENAVQVHLDTAELYWQFIGDETDVITSRARVVLTLPPGAAEGDVRAWGRGPLHGDVAIESPTRVVWSIEQLPGKTFLEGRVAFPVELVPEATNLSGKEKLKEILAEEEREALRANLRRAALRIDFILGPLLLLASVILYLVLRRKAVSHPSAYSGDYYRDLPGDYSPAEAGYLFRRGTHSPDDFTATVMDLARRGHLRLEEYQGESGMIRKRPFTDYRVFPGEGKDALANHEQSLFNFIFNQAGRGSDSQGVAFRDIEAYAKKNPSAVRSFYQRWQEMIKERVKKLGFFGGVAVPGIIFGFAVLIIGVVFITRELMVTGVIALFTGPVVIICSALIRKLTPVGADHYAKWQAFKRFLLHFSEMEQSTIPSLQVWEHYLVYAVSLGVAKEVMKQLQVVYPELKEQSFIAGTAWSRMAVAQGSGFNSLNSTLQQSFKTAFHSSSSSGSGGGGGFSGGGGRGGGGGGFSSR